MCHDSEVFRTRNFPLSITLALLVCTNSQCVLFSSYETITVANARMLPFVRSGAHYLERATSIQCLWNGVFTSRFIFRSALPASDQIFSFVLDSLKRLLDHCKGARKTYKAWIQSEELAHWVMYQRCAAASLAHAESANKTHGIVGRPV